SAVSFSTSPTLDIFAKEILDPAKRGARYWTQRYSKKIFSVNAIAQNEMPFQLPVGEVIRGLLISQYTDNPRTPIDSLIVPSGRVEIRANGTSTKVKTTWKEIVDKNTADYDVALPKG